MFEVVHYQMEDGKYPFREWIGTLRDKMAKIRIAVRINQIEAGNMGDCQPVGEGVIELRVHIGRLQGVLRSLWQILDRAPVRRRQIQPSQRH